MKYCSSILLSMILLLLQHSALFANTVNVADFNAIPDDGIDDTTEIRNAIAVCDKQGSTLIFEAGNYNISGAIPNSQGGGGTLFTLNSYDNLIIQGNNTKFIGQKQVMALD